MSDIKWCDAGGHAFSTNDKDRKSYVEQGEFGGELRQRIDVCGPCDRAGKLGLRTLRIGMDESEPKDTIEEGKPGNYDRRYIGHE